MQIRVLGASGGCAPGAFPSCYLLNGTVAVDAGAIATQLTLDEQYRVTDVLMTHSHLDHVRDLPLLLINGDRTKRPLRILSIKETLDAVKAHLFNREMWFEAFTIPIPLILSIELELGKTADVGGMKVTGFPLHHTVASTGWLVDDGEAAVFIAGDTDQEDCLVPVVKAAGNRLRAVFLEASFADEQVAFAKLTAHLTPAGVARAAKALPPGVPLFVTHMKPGHEDRIEAQLRAVGNPALRPVRSGETLEV
jgi:glyoxylase-like metal-dependent hydrolase (beta-lactamase superfamily II)